MSRAEVLAAIIAEETIPCPHYVGGLRPCRLDPTTIVLGCDGNLVSKGIKCGKEVD